MKTPRLTPIKGKPFTFSMVGRKTTSRRVVEGKKAIALVDRLKKEGW